MEYLQMFIILGSQKIPKYIIHAGNILRPWESVSSNRGGVGEGRKTKNQLKPDCAEIYKYFQITLGLKRKTKLQMKQQNKDYGSTAGGN